MSSRSRPNCSFCGKAETAQRSLIAGPDVFICSECVEVCRSMLVRDHQDEASQEAQALAVPKPHEIHAFLNDYVVGQEYAKKILSVAVHNHYKRVTQAGAFPKDHELADVEIEKSNILLIGPTGSGKTLLARTLARLLNVPFAMADATTLTEAGYVGEDVENILLTLIQNADGNVDRAQTGVVYVDEIDKIGRKTENVSLTRDVSGEGVQQALLKIIEGTIARVPPGGGRKHPQQKYIEINTENILFICGGAFVGLEDIVRRRIGRAKLGFAHGGVGAKRQNALDPLMDVEPEDLVRYGLIPEFVGRLPIATSLSPLTEEELVRIMVEPKNCMVRQYRKLLSMEGIDLSFTPAALRELARLAIRRNTGARGLRAIVEHLMLDVMYEAPRSAKGSLKITGQMVAANRVTLEQLVETSDERKSA